MRLTRLAVPCALALISVAACSSSDDNTDTGTATGASVSSTDASTTASTTSSTAATGGGGSSTASSSSSSSTSSTGGFTTAAHGAQPAVVNPFGGPTLSTPTVQLIAYADDPDAADVEAMINEFASSSAWTAQTSEYGVGPLKVLPAILRTDAIPTTIDDDGFNHSPLRNELKANTSGASPIWGAADASTIYLYLIPNGTNVTSSGNCCDAFLGYHYEDTVSNNVSVPYGIVCNCGAVQGYPLTALDWVTTTVNHEIVEAVTDPHPASMPAFAYTDDANDFWTVATGGEVADMCDDNADTNIPFGSGKYMIQRTWSNAAAAAGTNPCVPAPSDPFFNSMPVLADTVTIQDGSGTQAMGVKLAVGASKTIDVQLYSEAPTAGPWTVTAYDFADYSGYPAETTVSLDATSGQNGDVLHLTITNNSSSPTFGTAGFVLVSDLGMQENLAMGAVGP